MKPHLLRRAFLITVTAILLATAVAKTVTLLEEDRGSGEVAARGFLQLPAPYIPDLTNGDMMWVAVGFELAVVVSLTWLPSDRARLLLVAFVGGLFAAYHIGLGIIGYRQPCGCLGEPLDWLDLSRRAYDTLTVAIIGYLLAGSYGFLAWDGLMSLRRRPPAASCCSWSVPTE